MKHEWSLGGAWGDHGWSMDGVWVEHEGIRSGARGDHGWSMGGVLMEGFSAPASRQHSGHLKLIEVNMW